MAPRRTRFDSDLLPLGMQPRTLFVTGKGGVGKSTVAAATALAWRDAGARTLLVEIEGQASAGSLLTDQPVTYDAVPVGERVSVMRIGLADALREYARIRLKVKLVADRLVDNPIIDQFAQAAPGFRELLVLGKIWHLSRAVDARGARMWDAIVIDAPATGHGLGLLGMAGIVARMFPVGPISSEAAAVDAFVRDAERSGVLLVTLAEELPVTETLDLNEQLRERGVAVAGSVVNGLLVDRFTRAESQLAARMAADKDIATDVRHALDTVTWEHERCVDQARERARLADSLHVDAAGILPYMFTPELRREHVESLAQWLTPAGQQVLERQLAGAANGPREAAAVHAAQETTDT